MKRINDIIYFEDNDKVEEIKEQFLKIYDMEKKNSERLYGNKSKSNVQNALRIINSIDFDVLNKEEVSLIKNLLKKENNGIELDYSNILNFKITTYISLLDYLIRTKNIHDFVLEEVDKNKLVGCFKGEFSEELDSIQNILDLNAFSFYTENNNNNKGKVYFDFNQSLDFNIKSLVDNFIEDFEEEKFYDCYNKYLENKKNLNNKLRTKNKI